jgi:hypothetical protein
MKRIQIALFENKDKSFFQQAQNEEREYKKHIPNAFYEEVQWGKAEIERETEQIEREAREQKNLVIDGSIRTHVEKMYAMLRKDDKIPPKVARNITVLQFLPFRSKRHIERFITDPKSKSERHSKSALVGVQKHKAAQDEILNIAEKRIVSRLSHADAVKYGTKGGKVNAGLIPSPITGKIKENARAHLRVSGSKGGTESQVKQAEAALELEAAKEGVEIPALKEIVISIPADSEDAEKIRTFWGAPFGHAYLLVDTDGKILDVFNNDKTKRQEKKLEKPITHH